MPLLLEPPCWNQALSSPAQEVGRSVLGQQILLFGPKKAAVLVLAGVHGDEQEGMFLAQLLLHHAKACCILPCLNPDGLLLNQRWNQRNVDLNRNLPSPDWSAQATHPRYPPGTAPASEPENLALLQAIKTSGTTTLLSLHSHSHTLLEIERPLASLPAHIRKAIEDFCLALPTPLKAFIGYATPGALGSYARDNQLLLLTYELQRGSTHEHIHTLLPPITQLLQTLNAHPFQPSH